MIEIKHLTKQFKQKRKEPITVLNDVSFTIEDGDIYGIIGMSGAGKSTMIKLIGLLDQPTSGEILVDGKDIDKLKNGEKIAYYRSIGTVFQGYNLLMQRNVFDNVALPLTLSKTDKVAIKSRVSELLKIVGLEDKAGAYPATLSGGQKQRVAIARSLASNPKLILCDEPTSALDSITTDSILELLQDINKRLGVTVVIITHEIDVVRKICNKVAVLNEGILVDNGTVEEIEAKQGHDITRTFFGKEES